MVSRLNIFIISLICGTVTEILIFTWYYSHYTVENMTPILDGLRNTEPIVMVWDWLAPSRVDALFQLFLFWAVVPFVTMLVALPGWTKVAAIVLWLPYFYIDLIATAAVFIAAGQIELHNEIFTNFFYGIDPTWDEKIIVFLLRMPFSILLISAVGSIFHNK